MPVPSRRRRLGVFFTPRDVADALVAIAFDGGPAAPTTCDPACGDGVFLLAAATALDRRGLDRRTIARDLLWGCDIDPDAVGATRAAIADWSGIDPGDHLVVADGLTIAGRWPGRFEAVVGNPPFLNQLERATVRTTPVPAALAGLTRPYTDTAWLFLTVAHALLAPGGRAVLVQPQSIVAARDAAPVRAFVDRGLAGLWWCDEALFDASVHVCAPVLGRPSRSIRRWTGRRVAPTASVARATPAAPPGAPSWAGYVPTSTPVVDLDTTNGTLGDLATATAGFRDQFYGLATHVADGPPDPDGPADPAGPADIGDPADFGVRQPKLVTAGLIDVNAIHWGVRTTRFAGSRYRHPRVDVRALEPKLRRWVEQRLVPKVVLATQTKVLEAAVDERGEWVPSTPVIAVHTPAEELWRVAAVLTAPPVSAWAAAHHAGAALAPGAIKLAARQVLDVPLPGDRGAWWDAAAALAAGDTRSAASTMNRAYRADDDVLTWWLARADLLESGDRGCTRHH